MDVSLTSTGRVTLPVKVRDPLRVRAGDKLDIIINDDGEVMIRAKPGDWRQLIGILHRPDDPPVTDVQITEAFESGVVQEHRQKTRRKQSTLRRRP